MTDKQEIIIDSVDVSECKNYNGSIVMDCLLYPLQTDACKNNPNCYYKQLQRKTAECEELKNTLNKLTRGVVIPMQEPEVINLANHYHKTLDEIEEKVQDYKGYLIDFNRKLGQVDMLSIEGQNRLNTILDIISKAKGEKC